MALLQEDLVRPIDAPRSPDSRRDWRWLALGVGGVLFAVGNLLHPLEHTDAAYDAATWEAAHLTIFASLPLLILGLPALERLLASRVPGRVPALAVALSIVGLVGIAPGTVIEAFVAPTIGHEAMRDLESGGMAAVNGLLGSAYLGGTIALGWAARKARLQPGWAGPTLAVGAVALLGVMGATGPAVGVVIITATAAYGLALTAIALRARAGR